ncbi:Mediator complex, subunit Med7 like protein [Aduncisulcus paluster]|uniref:Mediator of RNA polymerase II transcription subunit 7 n=1 Tax=Aduncisulcus paluster TaxID=2918883 RepID=A0ABQ5K4T4_9EUKA|nr:Mediator complex, subunit Med7 like protein [Aduncisulcus paluster]
MNSDKADFPEPPPTWELFKDDSIYKDIMPPKIPPDGETIRVFGKTLEIEPPIALKPSGFPEDARYEYGTPASTAIMKTMLKEYTTNILFRFMFQLQSLTIVQDPQFERKTSSIHYPARTSHLKILSYNYLYLLNHLRVLSAYSDLYKSNESLLKQIEKSKQQIEDVLLLVREKCSQLGKLCKIVSGKEDLKPLEESSLPRVRFSVSDVKDQKPKKKVGVRFEIE